MKFVGLLSGGKDSCYNIMKCLDYGHELVCLGNLCPPSHHSSGYQENEEMNSYMYQTAGSNMVKFIAQCMMKPLVVRELNGTAIKQSLDYQTTENDEVEDLYQLLKDIKVLPLFPFIFRVYAYCDFWGFRRSILRLKVSLAGQSSQVIKDFVLKMFVNDLD
jgi:diphthamide synthase (EF-2-diphthine--ammonia ligase)